MSAGGSNRKKPRGVLYSGTRMVATGVFALSNFYLFFWYFFLTLFGVSGRREFFEDGDFWREEISLNL